MLEGKPTPAGSGHAAPGYEYPGDLARFVRDRWTDVPGPPGGVDPLPDTPLERKYSRKLERISFDFTRRFYCTRGKARDAGRPPGKPAAMPMR